MSGQTHQQNANFIWSICNLLRGPYRRNEYRKVILPRPLEAIAAEVKTLESEIVAMLAEITGSAEGLK